MKNKFIFLQIRRHYGELDWLFPLLYRLHKKKFRIFTYFDEVNAFSNLKKNTELYKMWKKICSDFYIQKKTDRFFFKIILKTLVNLNKVLKLSIIQNILIFFSVKVFDLKQILKNHDIENFDLYFVSNNNYSNLYRLFKNEKKSLKIIRFPTSQHVRYFNNKNQSFQKGQRIFYGDYYLFRYVDEAKMYFGNQKWNFKKIIFSGNMKYETWWVNKLFKKKIINKSKKRNIFFATRDFFSQQQNINDKANRLTSKSFNYMINSTMKLTRRFKNIRFIFKTHPSNKEYYPLINVLKNYKVSSWKIEHNHVASIIQKCEFGIVMLSSACLDIISMKKPCLEFWINNEDNFGLIKKNKKYYTTYQLNNLVKNVNSYDELLRMFKILNKKKNYNSILAEQYSNFVKVNKLEKYSSKKTLYQILN